MKSTNPRVKTNSSTTSNSAQTKSINGTPGPQKAKDLANSALATLCSILGQNPECLLSINEDARIVVHNILGRFHPEETRREKHHQLCLKTSKLAASNCSEGIPPLHEFETYLVKCDCLERCFLGYVNTLFHDLEKSTPTPDGVDKLMHGWTVAFMELHEEGDQLADHLSRLRFGPKLPIEDYVAKRISLEESFMGYIFSILSNLENEEPSMETWGRLNWGWNGIFNSLSEEGRDICTRLFNEYKNRSPDHERRNT